MPFWQRILITLAAMFIVSFLAGVIWSDIFKFALPSYVSGVIGGVTTILVWEFLKRVQPKK